MGHLRKELEVLKGHGRVQMHVQASFQCCSELNTVGFSHYGVLKALQQLPSRAGNSGLTSRKRTVTELKIEVSLEGCAGPWGKARQCLPIQAEPHSEHRGCRPPPARQARLPRSRSREGTCPVSPTAPGQGLQRLQSRAPGKQAGRMLGRVLALVSGCEGAPGKHF